MASSSPNPMYGVLFGLIGKIWPKEEVKTNIVSFMDCWDDPHSTFDPPGPDGRNATLEPARYKMVPRARIGYTVYPYEADHYTKNGYAGISKCPMAGYNGYFKWYSEFRLDGGEGPPDPGNPDR